MAWSGRPTSAHLAGGDAQHSDPRRDVDAAGVLGVGVHPRGRAIGQQLVYRVDEQVEHDRFSTSHTPSRAGPRESSLGGNVVEAYDATHK